MYLWWSMLWIHKVSLVSTQTQYVKFIPVLHPIPWMRYQMFQQERGRSIQSRKLAANIWLDVINSHCHTPSSQSNATDEKSGDKCLPAYFLSSNYQLLLPRLHLFSHFCWFSGAVRLGMCLCRLRCKAVAPLCSFLSGSFVICDVCDFVFARSWP